LTTDFKKQFWVLTLGWEVVKKVEPVLTLNHGLKIKELGQRT
jgi:hypothetical protein